MANCQKFLSMTEQEQKLLQAKLLHAIQSDPICFSAAIEIMALADLKGLYDGVVFNYQFLPDQRDFS